MIKDVVYRCIGNDFTNGILACGYMPKSDLSQSQENFQIDYYSCFFVLSGNGLYRNEDGREIPLRPGDFVQRFPNTKHSTIIVPDGEWVEFFISFGKGTYDYLKRLDLLRTDQPVIHINPSQEEWSSFSRFLSALKKAKEPQLPSLLLEAQAMLLHVLQTGIDEDDEPMKAACTLLSSPAYDHLSLMDIAHRLNLGYENFRKQFKASYGTSPAKYRREEKMRQAKLMLLSGNTIKDTAQMAGYSDTYSFTKQFTLSEGISPGRFTKSRNL